MWYEQKESKGGERGAEGQGEALLRRRQAACHVGIWQWRAQACQAGVLAGLLSLSFHSKQKTAYELDFNTTIWPQLVL